LFWEAAPKLKEAGVPAHGVGGGVRWLGTVCVAETEARRGGGGLPKTNRRRWHG
jgi:hypothetical protein